jgi:Holliday junction resolvase RusA-like endonuclease
VITNIAFTVPGEPQGKGRAKIVKIGGFSRMATPAKTVAYEGLVAHAAQAAMRGAEPFGGACALEVDVVCSVPKSYSGKLSARCLTGHVRPTKKPDADNVLKAICDGMNGVVWKDDVQAVEVRVSKRYGPIPGVNVRVALIEAADLLAAA